MPVFEIIDRWLISVQHQDGGLYSSSCALLLQFDSPNSLSRSLCLTLAVAIGSAANFCQALSKPLGLRRGARGAGPTFLVLSAKAHVPAGAFRMAFPWLSMCLFDSRVYLKRWCC